MRLVKIQDGLLEQDNFFKVAPFSDFLGDFQYTRKDGVFTLTKGYIERRMSHEDYVIVVEKENSLLNIDDELYFYVRQDYHRSGLIESNEDGVANISFWKLVRYDGFVQTYTSSDGKKWTHRGGGEIGQTNVQGFSIEGSTPLELKNYKVYRNPYVTLHGLEEGQIAYIQDEFGNTVAKRHAGIDGTVELMIEHSLRGRIKITSSFGVIFYESEMLELKYGDAYSITDYNLELYYKGELVEHRPTILDTLTEIVIAKNVSNDVYEDLKFRALVPSTDTVAISLNNRDYNDMVTLPEIKPQEEVPLYIKIEKDKNKANFGTRHFVLEID